mgnify:CR=1 FL=1
MAHRFNDSKHKLLKSTVIVKVWRKNLLEKLFCFFFSSSQRNVQDIEIQFFIYNTAKVQCMQRSIEICALPCLPFACEERRQRQHRKHFHSCHILMNLLLWLDCLVITETWNLQAYERRRINICFNYDATSVCCLWCIVPRTLTIT